MGQAISYVVKTKKLSKKQSGSKSPAGASVVLMDRAANAHHRDYTYDDQGRITQLQNGSLATFSYGYDNPLLGQRTSMTSALGTTNYSYDSNYQLTQANYPNVVPFNGEVHSWSYDNIGNRLSNTVNGVPANYTYYRNSSNQLNGQRLQSDGIKTYTYDNNGNVTGDGTNSYTWDYENRLTGITGPGLTASYSYDYLGRRASKTVNGATTTYLYDGQNLIRESGTTTADFVFGPGIDEPLAVSSGGLVSYYNVDGLGSVASLSDSAAALQNSYDYDAWGVLRNQTGSVQNSFLYTAREKAEAGLYFYRARYYQPEVAGFTAEDIRGEFSSVYAYVRNNPLRFKDPNGLEATSISPWPPSDCPPPPSNCTPTGPWTVDTFNVVSLYKCTNYELYQTEYAPNFAENSGICQCFYRKTGITVIDLQMDIYVRPLECSPCHRKDKQRCTSFRTSDRFKPDPSKKGPDLIKWVPYNSAHDQCMCPQSICE